VLVVDRTVLVHFIYVLYNGDLVCVSRDFQQVHEGGALRFFMWCSSWILAYVEWDLGFYGYCGSSHLRFPVVLWWLHGILVVAMGEDVIGCVVDLLEEDVDNVATHDSLNLRVKDYGIWHHLVDQILKWRTVIRGSIWFNRLWVLGWFLPSWDYT